ncbi:glycosyltransferase family 2 protein [Paraburkholderia denitrificans]|uniref:Glycosyltransferase family 2 protein n=1 Tax=Paraburkholderia denitrificans TaxID=694025 RepID=A0ABW0JB64_9BURK
MNSLVSVIVRTMPGREAFLDRCLFVLSGQTHEQIEVTVVVQYFGDSSELAQIQNVSKRWQHAFSNLQIVLNESQTDARAHSLNLGLQQSHGRYAAFLDDDDKVYPAHYEVLISALRESQFAWAYSDVVRAGYNAHGQLVSRTMPFHRSGYSFLFHLQDNFIPIHSFLIDRKRATDLPSVDESLCRLEDYDFLLRLAASHEPVYVPHVGCEYCIRDDGSNSVMDGTAQVQDMLQKQQLWNAARTSLQEKKYALVGWWLREVLDLPATAIAGKPHLSTSFRDTLRDYYQSTSWRLTRPLRNLKRRFAGLPRETMNLPSTEEDALIALLAIHSSFSWELTAPLRLLKRAVSRVRRAR